MAISQWQSHASVQAHKSGISCLAVYNELIVTGASDASVKVWTISDGEPSPTCRESCNRDWGVLTPTTAAGLQEVQTISLKKGYPVSLALAELPGNECEAIIYDHMRAGH